MNRFKFAACQLDVGRAQVAVLHPICQGLCDGGADVFLARKHRADGAEQLLGGLLLADIAAGAGLQGPHRIAGLLKGGKDQDAHLRMVPRNFLDQVHAVERAERQIEQDQVGLQRLAQSQRIKPGAAFADHLQFGLVFQHQADTLPDDGVVVNDNDLHRYKFIGALRPWA